MFVFELTLNVVFLLVACCSTLRADPDPLVAMPLPNIDIAILLKYAFYEYSLFIYKTDGANLADYNQIILGMHINYIFTIEKY